MAVFKAPRISSSQRGTLMLEASEIVYDTDENAFYGGNGIDLGGFPIGQGASGNVFSYTLTQIDINRSFIILPNEPFSPNNVRLNIVGGIEQINGIDFIVTGDVLSWDGLGLDNFLETGETLLIQY
jgi:hypothetical protein